MVDKSLEYIENIFHVAITLKAAERESYLAEACGDDVVARQEVESLVSAYEEGDGLLNETAVTLGMRVLGSIAEESITGKQIGSYKILGFLGKGGMGEVYLAEDRVLNRKVALKFLSGEFIADSWAKRQLVKEAQAVAMLDHPNICAVYGFEEVDEYSFIVMQYIEGRTLAELVRTKSITVSQIVPIAQQIVSALAEAHASGIIHRDIKPKNIMVTESGHVKVLDFGLAKTIHKHQTFEDATESISQLSKTGLLIGTIAYMSPEQLRGERLDYRSDIFSLGTVLYETACGKNPHSHETNAEVISAIMSGEPESLRRATPECPKGLDRVVEKCLKKDRTERYQSAAELLIDLDNMTKRFPLRPLSYVSLRSAVTLVVILLVCVIAAFIYSGLTRTGHTLAVLPIVCEDSGLNADAVCAGPTLTDGLIKQLSRRSDLRVKQSGTVPSLYGAKAVTPQQIGYELGADIVFFGKIKRRDNALVLTTRLENVRDGSVIAEDELSLKSEQLSLLEQEISLKTTLSLQLPLTSEERNLLFVVATSQNRSPEAYELYFRGRALWNKRDRENIQRAIELFRQATERDPLYARAYAGLADCYVLMNTVSYGAIPTREAMTKADWAAKEAIKLDETLPDAHTSLGVVWMKYHWDWENAEKEFKRAIELNRDFQPAHYWYSNLLAILARRGESLRESAIARDLQPFSSPAIMNHCRTLYLARKIDEADICLDKLAAEQPEYTAGKYIHGLVYLQKGKYQEATQIYEDIYARDKAQGGAMLGYCYGVTNRKTEALKVLSEMQALVAIRGYLPSQELAIIYLGLNDRDNAFALFRAAADERFPPLAGIFVDPLFDSIRSDFRFQALAKELKMPAAVSN